MKTIEITLASVTDLCDQYIIETKTQKAREWFVAKVHGFAVKELGSHTEEDKLLAWIDEYFNL